MLPWGNDFHFITTTPGNYQYLYIHSLKEQYIHTNICTSRYVSKHTHTPILARVYYFIQTAELQVLMCDSIDSPESPSAQKEKKHLDL